MLSIEPLPGPFGVAIDSLDLAQPLADKTLREVLAATAPDDRRLLYRVSVKGRPPLA